MKQLQNSFTQQNRPFETIFIHSPWPAHTARFAAKAASPTPHCSPVRAQGHFTHSSLLPGSLPRQLHPLLTAKVHRTFSCIRGLLVYPWPLVTGFKIIDFSGQSSFAIASFKKNDVGFA
jgi:hypothetical protein